MKPRLVKYQLHSGERADARPKYKEHAREEILEMQPKGPSPHAAFNIENNASLENNLIAATLIDPRCNSVGDFSGIRRYVITREHSTNDHS